MLLITDPPSIAMLFSARQARKIWAIRTPAGMRVVPSSSRKKFSRVLSRSL